MLANQNPASGANRAGLDIEVLANRRDRYPNTAIAENPQVGTDQSHEGYCHPTQLICELHRHANALDRLKIEWLLSRDIDMSAITGAGRHAYRSGDQMEPNLLFSANVCVIGPGAFEWPANVSDESATPIKALVWLGLDSSANPVDVIACSFRKDEARKIVTDQYTLVGSSDVSDEGVFSQRGKDEPLLVCFSALDWLRAGRNGALVTCENRHGGILRWADHLSVTTAADGERLKKLIAVKSPKISVRRAM